MILDRVVNAHLMQDYTAKIRAWIITSSGTGRVGYNLIRELFESNDVLARIISFAYSAGSAFAGFESDPIDRAVVEIAPKSHESGAMIDFYPEPDPFLVWELRRQWNAIARPEWK